MPARRAAPRSRTGGPVAILILAFEGVNLLDVSGPLQAFEASEDSREAALRYRTIVASVAGGPVHTAARLPIVTQRLADIDPADIDTIVVGGGSAAGRPIVPPELVAWIAANAAGARRVCSICSGAFILSAAGLLDGRRAATHWYWAQRLQAEHPAVRVDADAIYVNDGRYWTSAGVTAGIDLTLALIEQDHGHRVAIDAARKLVVFMKRPGGQAQFSVPLLQQSRDDSDFSELHAWISQNLAEDLRVPRLAARMGLSERSFGRRYAAQIGDTPARIVEAMRAEAACGMLEATALSSKRVAALTGFGDEQNMRRVFVRRLGLNPADYRQRFSRQGDAPGDADGRN
jgi:transcriptional regulator GlxA family with amidase domain